MDTALLWFSVHLVLRGACAEAGTEIGLIPSHLHVLVAGAFCCVCSFIFVAVAFYCVCSFIAERVLNPIWRWIRRIIAHWQHHWTARWCRAIIRRCSSMGATLARRYRRVKAARIEGAATLIVKANQERDRALQQAKEAQQYVDALQVAMREERAEHEKELATMRAKIQRLQALLTSPPPLLDHDDEDKCIICQEAPRATRFSECGHSQTCEGCLDRLFAQRRQPLCPQCRAPVARETVLRGAHIAREPAYMRQPAQGGLLPGAGVAVRA